MDVRWTLGLIVLVVGGCAFRLPETDTGTEGSTGADSTTTGPAPGSTGADSTTTGSTTTDSTTTDSTTGSTTTGSTTGSTSDGTDTDTSSSASSSGGDGVGFCAPACLSLADCVPPGGNAADWDCTDGFCEFVGMLPEPPPCDDQPCPLGAVCGLVEGVSQCTIPCTEGGNECSWLKLECIGMDDEGNPICASPPCGGVAEGEPCDFPMLGQYGVCTGGLCTCTDDSQCTVNGYACNV